MRRPGPYQLQAAIAAVHSHAETAAETDWREIAALYRELLRISPSPVVALNHAVAVAMSEGLEAGLKLVEQAGQSGELRDYHLFHAARADLLRRLGKKTEAASAYEQALRLAANAVEKEFLKRRLDEVLSRESIRRNTNL
jgi:RNA polymerase sigma-70 factor (ECF subfamily)